MRVLATVDVRSGPRLVLRSAVRADVPIPLVQLTTDKTRADAHRFSERLGFVSTHEGMKLRLPP